MEGTARACVQCSWLIPRSPRMRWHARDDRYTRPALERAAAAALLAFDTMRAKRTVSWKLEIRLLADAVLSGELRRKRHVPVHCLCLIAVSRGTLGIGGK